MEQNDFYCFINDKMFIVFQIVESEGDEALSAKVLMYENPTESQPQMSVTAQMACLRIIFLNRFVSSLLVCLCFDYFCFFSIYPNNNNTYFG
jgi:hypothetical protein